MEFHPLAADEAEAAERWYRDRNETAATRFRRELDRAVGLIAERPDAAPPYIGNTRRFLLRRFPFFVVYRVLASTSKSSRLHRGASTRRFASSKLRVFWKAAAVTHYPSAAVGRGA